MARPVARACLGLVLAALLVGCGGTVPPPSTVSPPSSAPPSGPPAGPAAPPWPRGLPVPHGHHRGCAPRSMRLGPARAGIERWTPHSAVRRLDLRLRNLGHGCVLHEPRMLYVASARGGYRAVPVQGLDARRAMPLRHGAVRWLRVVAWWSVPRPTAWMPCRRAVRRVRRIAIRTGPGYLRFPLRFTVARVCSAPPSMSFYVRMSRS